MCCLRLSDLFGTALDLRFRCLFFYFLHVCVVASGVYADFDFLEGFAMRFLWS